jgi:hypothetical protein
LEIEDRNISGLSTRNLQAHFCLRRIRILPAAECAL